jgi:hypothetical protein
VWSQASSSLSPPASFTGAGVDKVGGDRFPARNGARASINRTEPPLSHVHHPSTAGFRRRKSPSTTLPTANQRPHPSPVAGTSWSRHRTPTLPQMLLRVTLYLRRPIIRRSAAASPAPAINLQRCAPPSSAIFGHPARALLPPRQKRSRPAVPEPPRPRCVAGAFPTYPSSGTTTKRHRCRECLAQI